MVRLHGFVLIRRQYWQFKIIRSPRIIVLVSRIRKVESGNWEYVMSRKATRVIIWWWFLLNDFSHSFLWHHFDYFPFFALHLVSNQHGSNEKFAWLFGCCCATRYIGFGHFTRYDRWWRTKCNANMHRRWTTWTNNWMETWGSQTINVNRQWKKFVYTLHNILFNCLISMR